MDRQSLSPKNVAERWSVPVAFVNRLIRDGTLVAMNLGPKTRRIPMAEIAQYMGHSSVNTTFKHYARFSPEYLRGAATALEIL